MNRAVSFLWISFFVASIGAAKADMQEDHASLDISQSKTESCTGLSHTTEPCKGGKAVHQTIAAPAMIRYRNENKHIVEDIVSSFTLLDEPILPDYAQSNQ